MKLVIATNITAIVDILSTFILNILDTIITLITLITIVRPPGNDFLSTFVKKLPFILS